MEFLGPDYKIDVRQIFEQRGTARLRHAAEETENNVRSLFRNAAQHSHFAERLLVGHVAHAARIQKDNVGLAFHGDALVAACNE